MKGRRKNSRRKTVRLLVCTMIATLLATVGRILMLDFDTFIIGMVLFLPSMGFVALFGLVNGDLICRKLMEKCKKISGQDAACPDQQKGV